MRLPPDPRLLRRIDCGGTTATLSRRSLGARWRMSVRIDGRKIRRSCLTSDTAWAEWAAGVITRAILGTRAAKKSYDAQEAAEFASRTDLEPVGGGGSKMRRSSEPRIRLTPLGRSLVLPAKVQRDCIGRAARLLRGARSAMDFGLALARDGHHAGARECFRQAAVDLRAARGRLGVLFAEDWRHQ